jgi:hypothetical protein
MKTTPHPTLPITLTFDPATHTYRDNHGADYISVTTLTHDFFPKFNEAAALESTAKKTGKLEMEILAEWTAKKEASSRDGTATHFYAESLVIGSSPPAPENDRQRQAFAMVDSAITMLAPRYEFLAAEQIVFDPLSQIAGTIDLPARNRKTGALAILDWKTCEDITSDAYRRTALPPIANIPDSKVHSYTIQLSLYAWILTDATSPYPTAGEPVELALIHLPHIGADPIWRPLDYLHAESAAIVGTRCQREAARIAEG